MSATLIPVTLVLAGALALLNGWLVYRVGQVRRAHGVSVGDGGVEPVTRRMRAHANFAENVPIVAILVAAIELSAGTSPWLWAAAAVFVVARVAHAIGMDGSMTARMTGLIATLAVQTALALWAIAIPLTAPHADHVQTVTMPASG